MTIDLETHIASLATEWDHAAPPINLTELSAAAPQGQSRLRPTPQLIEVDDQHSHPRRGWWLAVASVLVVGTAVSLLARTTDDRDIDRAPDASGTITVEPTVIDATAPSTADAPTSTDAPTTSMAPTAPPITIGSADLLTDVTVSAGTKLASIESFRATATVRRVQAATSAGAPALDTTTVHDITLTADGNLWVVGGAGATLTWASYDTATSLSRNSYVDPDGAVKYQEVAGWADNSTPLLIVAQFDPTMRLDALGDGVTVEPSTSGSGRSGWTITATTDVSGMSETADEEVDQWFVDEATGLILEHSSTQLSSGAVMSSEQAALTDLEVGAALPAAFPGTFPDGAEVDRSGDPAAVTTLTLSAARDQFGAGLVAPAGPAPDVRISVRTNLGLGVGGDNRTFPGIEVTIQTRRGFLRQTVTVTKWLPLDGGIPAGYVVVDGAICSAPAGSCNSPSTLDEARRTMVEEGGFIALSVRGVEITVDARTPDDTRALAESLVEVG